MSLACIITAVFQFVQISGNPTLSGGIRVILGYIEVSWTFFKVLSFLNAKCLISFFPPLLKASVSLFVCNLLVIVTYFYKVFRQRDIEEMPTTTHNRSQEMYETDRPSQQPIPLGNEEYATPINFTEISGAYFTDPILTSNEDSKINGERLQATVTSWLTIVISRFRNRGHGYCANGFDTHAYLFKN